MIRLIQMDQKSLPGVGKNIRKRRGLYLSLPIGRPRICFNAHRIHTAQQILIYFSDLKLVSFSIVDDQVFS